MKDRFWNVIQGSVLGVAICLLALLASAQNRTRREFKTQIDELKDEIRKTCAAGAALVAHVDWRLEQEPNATHLAQDLIAYGLPWLDLCASTPVDPLLVVQPDQAAAAVRALRADLDRWR